ncbi:hypothetical protein GCM10010282_46930 [Streptomyces roseolus]|nr:hypothetical protein GCM10010282_46930 [Streptomyces roseolus]
MDVEAVTDLAPAEALAAEGHRLGAEALEVRVPVHFCGHARSVVRNADVRVETVGDSTVRGTGVRGVDVLRISSGGARRVGA